MLTNLRAALAARGMRQVDLAAKLKIWPSVMSDIVNGRRSPEPRVAARIAEILRVDESLLFGEKRLIPLIPMSPVTPQETSPSPAMAAVQAES
jgi:transcriptional regulator with XRE-family HTH domain